MTATVSSAPVTIKAQPLETAKLQDTLLPPSRSHGADSLRDKSTHA
jgi:hypothetical protein